jgi:hypothetical protein
MTTTTVFDDKFGLKYADTATESERENWVNQTKRLIQKLIVIHDKLYGTVGSRTVMMPDLKLVYNDSSNIWLIGNNINVFPSPYTPLFEQSQFAPEVIYNEIVRNWITKSLKEELVTSEKRYVKYVSDLTRLASGLEPKEVVSTTE